MEQVKLNIFKKAIDEKKGEDIQVFDVTGRNPSVVLVLNIIMSFIFLLNNI